MPTIQIDIAQGRTLEQKRELAKKMTATVVEVLQCPPEAVNIVMRDLPRENFAKAGVLLSDR